MVRYPSESLLLFRDILYHWRWVPILLGRKGNKEESSIAKLFGVDVHFPHLISRGQFVRGRFWNFRLYFFRWEISRSRTEIRSWVVDHCKIYDKTTRVTSWKKKRKLRKTSLQEKCREIALSGNSSAYFDPIRTSGHAPIFHGESHANDRTHDKLRIFLFRSLSHIPYKSSFFFMISFTKIFFSFLLSDRGLLWAWRV